MTVGKYGTDSSHSRLCDVTKGHAGALTKSVVTVALARSS